MAEQGHEPRHDHGKMDITEQEKTYQGFMRFSTRTVIGIIVLLILLYAIAG